MDLTNTQALELAVALGATGTDGTLDGAQVRLFVNDVQPVRGSVVGDFTETNYTGHADEDITWLAPTVADDGHVEVIGTVGEFRPTDGVTPNVVYGAVILDSGGAVMMGGRFDDAPLPMNSALDNIVLTVRFRPFDGSIAVVVS